MLTSKQLENSCFCFNQSIIYLPTLSSKSTSARSKYEHALNLQFYFFCNFYIFFIFMYTLIIDYMYILLLLLF